MSTSETLDPTIELADWRRRVSSLYAKIRSMAAPAEAWEHWRATRSELFRNHPMSPVSQNKRTQFSEINCFEYNPAFRFEVRTEPVTSEAVDVHVGKDGVLRMRAFSKTIGLEAALGSELELFWIEGYGGGVFLPFKDGTSGGMTYGGGRYLLDAIKSADLGATQTGELILDFNFAYHPSCAWNVDYVCPLSPPQNTLLTAIEAGERMPL